MHRASTTNSLKFVVWKDKKAVAAALKKVYDATDEATALHHLENFESNWNTKYPYIAKSWRANWSNLTTFLEYPPCIRKIIYTTNIIENINRIIRKYTKTKTMLTKRSGSRKSSIPIANASIKKMDHASKRLAHYAHSFY